MLFSGMEVDVWVELLALLLSHPSQRSEDLRLGIPLQVSV